MIVKLSAEVLFASGSAELSKDGQSAIGEVTSVLKHITDRRFMVAGHTDIVPIGPSAYKSNWELSTARAVKVVEAMIAAGMNPNRLVAAGYGEHEPVRPNTTEAGRKENRRIEVVLLPNIAELPLPPAGSGTIPPASESAVMSAKPRR